MSVEIFNAKTRPGQLHGQAHSGNDSTAHIESIASIRQRSYLRLLLSYCLLIAAYTAHSYYWQRKACNYDVVHRFRA